jgi:hypothetical protein
MAERNVDPNQIAPPAAPPSDTRTLNVEAEGGGNKLYTGVPGFEINGLVYTYDVGDPDRRNIPGYPLAPDRGQMTTESNDPPRKDLSIPTKDTLARYLANKTGINYYSISGQGNPFATPTWWLPTSINAETELTTPKIPSPAETTKNGIWFTKGKNDIDGTSRTSETLRNWKPRENFIPSDVGIGPVEGQLDLKKGKDPDGRYDLNGNALLSTPDNIPKLENFSSLILRNNRFTSNNKFAAVVSPEGDEGNNNIDSFKPKFYHPIYGEFSTEKMAQIAPALLLRAADGELKENPSEENLALKKIDLVKLEAQDAIRSLMDVPVPVANFTKIADGSWGSLTSFENHFDGLSQNGMEAMAIALSSGVFFTFESLLRTIDVFIPRQPENSDPNNEKNRTSLKLGVSRVTAQTGKTSDTNAAWDILYDLTGLFGFMPTFNRYTTALYAGISAMFGRNSSKTFKFFGVELPNVSGFSEIPGSINFAVTAPGYISVMARAFLRATTTFYNSMREVNINDNEVVNGIKVVSNSKIVKILNAIASVGDAVVSGWDYQIELAETAAEEDPYNVHEARLKKDSKKTNPYSLPWSTRTSPSLYLLPNSIKSFSEDKGNAFGGSEFGGRPLATLDEESRSYFNLTEKRAQHTVAETIGDETTVEFIENELEAAYVPFYFHDLRTNEIISFHAFLDSLSDNFSVSYETPEGFGRVEPIRIYKGTQRKIGMSFYVAALDERDFDEMWLKINKLVTLVYPQYTEGRRLSNGDYNFVQPFSQMIGASPLIRLRLGNLIRSNYSKFALARLFGATLGDTRYIDKSGQRTGQANNVQESFSEPSNEEIFQRAIQKRKFFKLKEGAKNLMKQEDGTYFMSSKKADIAHLPFIAQGNNPSEEVTLTFAGWGDPVQKFLLNCGWSDDIVKIGKLERQLKACYGNKNNRKLFIEGKNFKIRLGTNIQLSAKDEKEIREEISKEKKAAAAPKLQQATAQREKQQKELDGTLEGLNEFMDSAKNSIVKSFESAGGKGLAGVIDSIDFDWFDKVTWDIDAGRKAPKMCKVTISFSPIHDISPGLDSQGYNRAPVYPVSPIRKS